MQPAAMYYADDGGMMSGGGGQWTQGRPDNMAVVPRGRTQYYQGVAQGPPPPDQVVMYGGGPAAMADPGFYSSYAGAGPPMDMMYGPSPVLSKPSSTDRYTAWSGLWRQKGAAYRVQQQAAPPPQSLPQPQLVWVDAPPPSVTSYGPPAALPRAVQTGPYQQSGYQVYQSGGPAYQQQPAQSYTRTYYQ